MRAYTWRAVGATLGLTLATVMSACNTRGANEKTGDSAMQAAVDSSPLMTRDTAGARRDSAGGLSDANIVAILDHANMADSANGAIAAKKGTSADVKSFGTMMMGEHHALRQQGQALAKKLNIAPRPPANDQSEAQQKAVADSLDKTAKGAAWDRAYIQHEVQYHQQVLETATKALAAAQNAELKSLIQQAAPVIQKHLDRAKQIQSKLGGGTKA